MDNRGVFSEEIKDITSEVTTSRRITTYVDTVSVDLVLAYRGVPLWMAESNLQPAEMDGCKIALVGNRYEGYSIIGRFPVIGFGGEFEYHTYGHWLHLEAAERWLERPYPQYLIS